MSNPQIRADERGGAAVTPRPRGFLGDLGGPRGVLRALGDRGQAAIEFTGMVPIILFTAVMLWQAALVGYTFSLAGNAADEAVRAGTVALPGMRNQACEEAGEDDLPGAWDSSIECHTEGDLLKARVDLDVPLLFPGSVNFGLTVPGKSAAVKES